MFPYVMLLTMPLFSSPDWPKRLISHFPCYFQQLLPSSSLAQSSNLCLYDITELPNDQVKNSTNLLWVYFIKFYEFHVLEKVE